MRRPVWSRFALALAVVLCAGAAAAEPYVPRCQIGRPAYCLKYGQMFCLKENARKDRDTACAQWESACLECHAEIGKCLNFTRPLMKSVECKTCDDAWHRCMRVIDKKFWPNRLNPPREH